MKLEFERPLFIGAHPDDNCLGAGGLMSRLKKEGKEFHCVTMTCFDEDRRRNWVNAMEYVKPKSYEIFDFLASYLEEHKHEFRRALLEIKDKIQPDVVFTHHLDSSHPDHNLLAREIRKLFRYQTIFGHQGLKGEGVFYPTVFFEINEDELEDKIKALSFFAWEKQYQAFMKEEAIRARARVYGIRVGVEYAEGFNILRMKL